jgi:ABC-type transport system substrate-binding protein
VPENQTEAVVERSDFSKAGITLNLRPVAPADLFEDAPECKPSQSDCTWDMMSYQNYTPFPYPYAGINMSTGGVYNFGSYSDPTTDKLLRQAAVAPKADGLSKALAESNDRILQQAAQIYDPVTPYQLSEIKTNLQGVTPQNPQFAITPELWSFTK